MWWIWEMKDLHLSSLAQEKTNCFHSIRKQRLCLTSATKDTNLCGSKLLEPWKPLWFLSAAPVCSGAAVWLRSWRRCDLHTRWDHFGIWEYRFKQNTMRCTDVMKCPCWLRPKRRTCGILTSIWVLIPSSIVWVSSLFNTRETYYVSAYFPF